MTLQTFFVCFSTSAAAVVKFFRQLSMLKDQRLNSMQIALPATHLRASVLHRDPCPSFPRLKLINHLVWFQSRAAFYLGRSLKCMRYENSQPWFAMSARIDERKIVTLTVGSRWKRSQRTKCKQPWTFFMSSQQQEKLGHNRNIKKLYSARKGWRSKIVESRRTTERAAEQL